MVTFRGFPLTDFDADDEPNFGVLKGWGEFTNGADLALNVNQQPGDLPEDPWEEPLAKYNCADSQDSEINVVASGAFLVAALTLLEEHLVSDHPMADPAPKLNRARAKRGKPPLSGPHHVLTINTAALRRVAQRPTGSHESPRLHWRRGHWRVIHWFSEFENRVWVRRCLVGDPDLGFVAKNYRLVFMPPMPSQNGALARLATPRCAAARFGRCLPAQAARPWIEPGLAGIGAPGLAKVRPARGGWLSTKDDPIPQRLPNLAAQLVDVGKTDWRLLWGRRRQRRGWLHRHGCRHRRDCLGRRAMDRQGC